MTAIAQPITGPDDTSHLPVSDVHTLRYGYNLADLDRLAKYATRRVFGVTVDPRDRFEVAWTAIVEHLYTAADRPDPSDLITAGQQAISRHHRTELHHHGVQQRTYAPAPRHAVYWEAVIRPTPSPESRTVDRVALWQIWPQLAPGERAVVQALAAHGTHQGAADALGISYQAFASRLSCARRRFLALWHEGETPSRLWRTELRASQGTARTPASVTRARLATFADLDAAGLTRQQIAARMGLSLRTVARLAARYRAERGL
ncbi:helix-turn-helix domain-containing protein [Actinomadura geliboluensis]|uniref:helix-turn-helix domain-containing protein n=1 Tax=Actinomadura geliboluensis TaxID=882440 RepID=UPI0036A36327